MRIGIFVVAALAACGNERAAGNPDLLIENSDALPAPDPDPVDDTPPPFMSTPTPPGISLQAKTDMIVRQHASAGDYHVGLIVGVVTPTENAIYYYGTKSDGGTAKPDAQTAFRIGSITKTFTATLLALYASRGTVSISACPGAAAGAAATTLQAMMNLNASDGCALPAARKAITLEQLATHRAGLPKRVTRTACTLADLYAATCKCLPDVTGGAYTDQCAPGFCPDGAPCATGSCSGACGYAAGDCPLFPPGTDWAYSNWGFSLLGRALIPPGKAWWPINRSAILDPLGMSSTFTDEQPAAGVTMAPGYDGCGDAGGCQKNQVAHPSINNPAGGLWSTGPDMMSWLKYIMGLPQSDPATSARAELYKLQPILTCARAETRKRNGVLGHIGLGWQIDALSSTDTMIWKGGDWAGFHAWAGFVPSRGVGAFVMSNSNPSNGPGAIAQDLLSKL
jgi:CubicO group peptidase (beta-lactamase class C family)